MSMDAILVSEASSVSAAASLQQGWDSGQVYYCINSTIVPGGRVMLPMEKSEMDSVTLVKNDGALATGSNGSRNLRSDDVLSVSEAVCDVRS